MLFLYTHLFSTFLYILFLCTHLFIHIFYTYNIFMHTFICTHFYTYTIFVHAFIHKNNFIKKIWGPRLAPRGAQSAHRPRPAAAARGRHRRRGEGVLGGTGPAEPGGQPPRRQEGGGGLLPAGEHAEPGYLFPPVVVWGMLWFFVVYLWSPPTTIQGFAFINNPGFSFVVYHCWCSLFICCCSHFFFQISHLVWRSLRCFQFLFVCLIRSSVFLYLQNKLFCLLASQRAGSQESSQGHVSWL